MLLGNGMLGVNLKQCYLKQHGVFIDFLVQGGQAKQAKQAAVVKTGDLLVRLGDLDLHKGTIVEILQTIAKSKRPVVLVLATGTHVPLERMHYVVVNIGVYFLSGQLQVLGRKRTSGRRSFAVLRK
jgi:hypothetical protein